MALSVTDDAEWAALCQAIGRADLTCDPRFEDGLSRWRNQDALDPHIEA